jgi:hypothetical protein
MTVVADRLMNSAAVDAARWVETGIVTPADAPPAAIPDGTSTSGAARCVSTSTQATSRARARVPTCTVRTDKF